MLKFNSPLDFVRVLVIDDEQKMEHLYQSFLDHDQIELTFFSHPQEAWQLLDKKRFDLVITDLKMPIIQGNELIQIIRNNPINSDVPIILSSAHIMKATMAELSLVNKVHYLAKPFTSEQLVDVVNKILRLRRPEHAFIQEVATSFLISLEEVLKEKTGQEVERQGKHVVENTLGAEGAIAALGWEGKSLRAQSTLIFPQKVFFDLISKMQGTLYREYDQDIHSAFFLLMDDLSLKVKERLMSEHGHEVFPLLPSLLMAKDVMTANTIGFETRLYTFNVTSGKFNARLTSLHS